jgi:hypothetical protein
MRNVLSQRTISKIGPLVKIDHRILQDGEDKKVPNMSILNRIFSMNWDTN